jgi:hypothetical protein
MFFAHAKKSDVTQFTKNCEDLKKTTACYGTSAVHANDASLPKKINRLKWRAKGDVPWLRHLGRLSLSCAMFHQPRASSGT